MCKNNFDDFEDFISWLKLDGLQPYKSERLWRKKIFSNLINNERKTIDNYNDFLIYKKLQALIECRVIYENVDAVIYDITSNHKYHILKMNKNFTIKVRHDLLDVFIQNNVKEFKC